MICSSLTDVTTPLVKRIAATARSHEAGSPIRIAVAIVSARTLVRFAKLSAKSCANGAAPLACTDKSRGIRLIKPSPCASRKAFPNADVLPRFPAGSATQSGDCHASCCSNSNMMVFCPSIRNGLSELAKYTPNFSLDSRTKRKQSSKSPRTNNVRAPYATV